MPRQPKLRPAERWQDDADYREKLSEAERKWYDDFIEAHYGGDKRARKRLDYSPEDEKKANKARYANRMDAFTGADVRGILYRSEALSRLSEDDDSDD